MLLFSLLSGLFISGISLNINNISDVVDLTSFFIDENAGQYSITPGQMSYYIALNDVTKTKYLWYGMSAFVNESSGLATYIESDIFDDEWKQYSNDLPFIIGSANVSLTSDQEIAFNVMCTSPVTNDILTCWINISDSQSALEAYNIFCRIYYVKLNIFSDVIQLTSSSFNVNIFHNALCFNDSYFIPWSYVNPPWTTGVYYGTLLDLKGNIVQNNIDLNASSHGRLVLGDFYTSKGSDKFDVKQINKNAMDSFVLNIVTFITERTDIMYIMNIYGYYTNLNDSNQAINVYNKSVIGQAFMQNNFNFIILFQNTLLDWTSECCFLSIYLQLSESYTYDYYGLITDFKGNNIDILQYPNVTNIPLIMNSTGVPLIMQMIDLPVISDDTTRYFMIVYLNDAEGIYYQSDTIVCTVFGLQYDRSQNVYNLFNAGSYDTVKLINSTDFQQPYFKSVYVYNLPDTNKLYFSWEQVSDSPQIVRLYGQTFQIY